MSKSPAHRTALRVAVIVSLAFVTAPARADSGRGTIAITFSATSTLHDFEGEVPPLAFQIESGPQGAWGGDVEVPVDAIDTGIEKRDAGLRAMFDAAHHPRIRGRVRDLDPERARTTRVLPLLLRIRDVELPIEAKLSNWQQDERSARFDADFDVSLRDFSLEAPSILFVEVGDLVHVTVHVTLERS